MSESTDQIALFAWAAMNESRYPELAALHAIPNAGGYTGGFKQNFLRVLRMLQQGVRQGVPDISLPVPRGGYHGLYIEMKSGRNRPTDEQLCWATLLWELGHAVTFAWGWEAARDDLMAYLEGRWGC